MTIPNNNSGIISVELPDAVMRAWDEAVQAPGVEYQEHGPHDAFIAEAVKRATSAHAFEPLSSALDDLKNYRLNAVFVKNVPVDPNLVSSPTNGFRPAGKSSITERILLGLVSRDVDPFGYEQEKGGRLVHEVAPVPGLEKTLSNGSREVFAAHMDNAFLDQAYRPFWLALIGLVNPTRVATWVYSLRQVLSNMEPALVADLYRQEFRLRCPDSFKFPEAVWVPNRAILETVRGTTIGGFNHGYNVEATTARAQRALDALNRAVDNTPAEEIVIVPGTVLIFNNTSVLHGRAKIEAAGERWLQRVYGTADLGRLQQASGQVGRVFDTVRFLPAPYHRAA